MAQSAFTCMHKRTRQKLHREKMSSFKNIFYIHTIALEKLFFIDAASINLMHCERRHFYCCCCYFYFFVMVVKCILFPFFGDIFHIFHLASVIQRKKIFSLKLHVCDELLYFFQFFLNIYFWKFNIRKYSFKLCINKVKSFM